MRGGLGNETVTNSARTQFPASVTSELPTIRPLHTENTDGYAKALLTRRRQPRSDSAQIEDVLGCALHGP
jgi:hypothetical protein